MPICTWSTLERDGEFLLRCALTHHWEGVQQACALLLTKNKNHHHSANSSSNNSNAETTQRRHDICQKQLRQTDQWGNTALTAACYNHPPVEAVQALLKTAAADSITAPKAPQDGSKDDSQPFSLLKWLLLHRARDGSTALQVACATGASNEVIRVLLEHATQVDVAATATIARRSSASACTMIYTCLEASVVDQLVRQADAGGSTPLNELVVYYHLQSKSPQYNSRLVSSSNSNLQLDQIDDLDACLLSSPLFATFWTKACLLLQAAWPSHALYSHEEDATMMNANNGEDHCPDRDETSVGDPKKKSDADRPASYASSSSPPSSFIPQQQQASLIHQVAHVAEACPTVLMDLILRCSSPPNAASTALAGRWLPLHVVLESSIQQYQQQRQQPEHVQCTVRRNYLIQTLLQSYPAAVQWPVPTTPSQKVAPTSLLSRAIAAGWHWHDRRATTFPRKNGTVVAAAALAGPIQRIWQLDPTQLSVCDAATGLLPFLHAAVNNQENNALASLETLYRLIRADPLVLLSSVRRIQRHQ